MMTSSLGAQSPNIISLIWYINHETQITQNMYQIAKLCLRLILERRLYPNLTNI